MVKEEIIGVRVSKEYKNFLQGIADSRGITLSDLVLGLLSDGAKLEEQRRERLRQIGLVCIQSNKTEQC